MKNLILLLSLLQFSSIHADISNMSGFKCEINLTHSTMITGNMTISTMVVARDKEEAKVLAVNRNGGNLDLSTNGEIVFRVGTDNGTIKSKISDVTCTLIAPL